MHLLKFYNPFSSYLNLLHKQCYHFSHHQNMDFLSPMTHKLELIGHHFYVVIKCLCFYYEKKKQSMFLYSNSTSFNVTSSDLSIN